MVGTGITFDLIDNDSVSTLKVNFQPLNTPTVADYDMDRSAVSGSRAMTSLGGDTVTSVFAHDSTASPDQRHNTLALPQGAGATK